MQSRTQLDKRRLYEQDGYYIHRDPVLSADLVARAQEGMDRVRDGVYETGVPPRDSYWKPGDDPGKLVKIEMPQLADRACMEVVSHPEIGRIAAELTGATMIQVWWVQLLIKPPTRPEENSRTNVGWHQDRQYWSNWEPDSELLTAWVALSDVTETSGPMEFVPGSHRLGLLEQGDFYEQDLENQAAAFRLPGEGTRRKVPATLPPGGVSFHHHLTLHGSGPNFGPGPRRSFALHLRTEKSRPVNDERRGLAEFIDNEAYCPVIYGRLT